MKRFLHDPDIGLLLLRSGVGVVFLAHGITKVGSLSGTMNFFASIGLPSWMAYGVTFVETTGAAALMLGVLPRLAGGALAAVMVGAISLVKFKTGFIGGFELELLLLLSTLAIVFSGAGKYSLDRFFTARKTSPAGTAAKEAEPAE